MGAPQRLVAFAAVLVAVFGISFGVGRVTGAEDDARAEEVPADVHDEADDHGGSGDHADDGLGGG